jgi:acetyltransferase-like isoleucine patch superfamily enzyme
MKFNNRNVFVSSNAKLGNNVKIGDNTSIYDNVVIGDNTIICNDCIIGEPTSAYYKDISGYTNPPTIIGANSMIRSHAIIYAGSSFGNNLVTGHRITIREGASIGKNCLISTLADIQGNCKIGEFSRIYSNVHIGELTTIGNYVFIFPYSIFTNDPQPPSNMLMGAVVGDYSIITVHCSVLPGVKIGKNCLVGANSVVSKNIDDFSYAIGSPAKKLKDIREIYSKQFPEEKHYPWPYSFDRGMPWQGLSFDEWLKNQTEYND